MTLKNNFFTTKKIGWLLVIALILGIIFFLLPKNSCDDSIDPQLKLLSKRADSGDTKAIATLYSLNKSRGIDALAEYWALKGALQGDVYLRKEYVFLFNKRFSPEEKQRSIEVVKTEGAMPGAKCLMAFLIEDKDQQRVCPQQK